MVTGFNPRAESAHTKTSGTAQGDAFNQSGGSPPNVTPEQAIELGWSIIPTNKGTKKPALRSWKPYQTERATLEDLATWNARNQQPNYAVVTGDVSDLIILDFDGEPGRATMERLGLSPHVQTPSGGYHVYFKHPGWRVPTTNDKAKKSLHEGFPGTDIKGDGGYALFAGAGPVSKAEPKGEQAPYTWLREPVPDSFDIVPDAMLPHLQSTATGDSTTAVKEKRGQAQQWAERAIKRVNDGAHRNDTGLWLAQQLRDSGLSRSVAKPYMQEYATAVTDLRDHPYPDTDKDEIGATLRSVYLHPARPAARGSGCPKPKPLALMVAEGQHFAKDGSGMVYTYRNGVYLPDKDAIGRRFDRTLEANGLNDCWKKATESEVEHFIMRNVAKQIPPKFPRDVINTRNGLLYLESGELKPHTPEVLTTYQVNAEFDPKATCPTWDTFIKDLVADDAIEFTWNVIALLMVPSLSMQNIIFLLGEGDNGKSTFAEAIGNLVGNQNVSRIGLDELTKRRNQFTLAGLYGKVLNLGGEVSEAKINDTAYLKAISGGEKVEGERKFKDRFAFDVQTKLLYLANVMPKSSDSTKGFYRRILPIPFFATFDKPRDQQELWDALSQEHSGVLNRVLEAYARIKGKRLEMPRSSREQVERYKHRNDSVKDTLDRVLIRDPGAKFPKQDLFALVRKMHPERDFSDKAIINIVLEYNHEIRYKEDRMIVDGKSVRAFGGYRLDPSKVDLPDSKGLGVASVPKAA